MRLLAILGLGLYGVANLFAGIYDWSVVGRLTPRDDLLLIITGAVLVTAAALVARRARRARAATIAAMVLASALAAYNERVLGLGHPSHHLVRGAYTLLVLWAVWRSTRSQVQRARSSD
jgi:hypothetical protein